MFMKKNIFRVVHGISAVICFADIFGLKMVVQSFSYELYVYQD